LRGSDTIERLDIGQIVIAFVALLFSLTVHEAAHAWAAYRCGDSTAWSLGRLTLNPLPHVDVLGTVVFPLMAIATSVPVIGWAKPVPVDLRQLRRPRRDAMLVSAAGPASNVLLAVAAAVVIRMIPVEALQATGPGVAAPLVTLVGRLLDLNVLLALFNLLPIPPLDGSGVVEGLLPRSAARAMDVVRPYGFVLLYGLMLSGWLAVLIGRPYSMVMSWLL